MKKILNYIPVLLAILLVLAACTTEEPVDNGKTQVVASISPVYEMTKAIAGDQAEVSLMVGANEDAHHYEPSAQAVASVNEADIFIYSSEVMEFWADSLLDVVESDTLQVIELAEDLDLALADSHEEDHDHDHEHAHDHDHEHNHEEDGHDHGGLDPHFWLDPLAVKQQLPLITEALITADPAGADVYRQNAEDFSEELIALDEAYQEAFNEADNRVFVVQHQAFGHLAARYDLEQIAIGGLTTEVEPAPQKLAQITDFVKEQQVPVTYYQSGENSAIAETIAKETGTEIAVLHDLENVPVGLNDTNNLYLEAMYQNLEQLKLSIQ